MADTNIRLKAVNSNDTLFPQTKAELVIDSTSRRFVSDSEKKIRNSKTNIVTVETLPQTGKENVLYDYQGNLYIWKNSKFELLGVGEYAGDILEFDGVDTIVAKISTTASDIVINSTQSATQTINNIKQGNTTYGLPIATKNAKGTVKIGSGLNVDGEGTVSVMSNVLAYEEI